MYLTHVRCTQLYVWYTQLSTFAYTYEIHDNCEYHIYERCTLQLSRISHMYGMYGIYMYAMHNSQHLHTSQEGVRVL